MGARADDMVNVLPSNWARKKTSSTTKEASVRSAVCKDLNQLVYCCLQVSSVLCLPLELSFSAACFVPALEI